MKGKREEEDEWGINLGENGENKMFANEVCGLDGRLQSSKIT